MTYAISELPFPHVGFYTNEEKEIIRLTLADIKNIMGNEFKSLDDAIKQVNQISIDTPDTIFLYVTKQVTIEEIPTEIKSLSILIGRNQQPTEERHGLRCLEDTPLQIAYIEAKDKKR